MRKLRMLMMMGCIPMILGAEEYKEPEKINLNKGWEFSQVGKSEWLPAKVPGTVHQDLINHGMIPNPFYGKNEEKVQWVRQLYGGGQGNSIFPCGEELSQIPLAFYLAVR